MAFKNNIHNARGFTLVETLIAISILLVSIVTPLVGVSQAMTAAFLSRDEITAFYLAQDAIEYVRNARDSNGLSGAAWNEGFSACNVGCTVNTLDENGLQSVDVLDPMGEAYRLKYFEDTGIYADEGEDSLFFRKVVIAEIPGNEYELKVTVTVSWHGSSGEKQFIAEENLTDWQ